MNLEELVTRNRSYRKFRPEKGVPPEMLESLIDLARKVASSKNIQPLRYMPVTAKDQVDFLFSQLGWARHLEGWDGPMPQQRPPAYIIMLMDTLLNDRALIDAGIAAQTILLGATEKSLGGCIIRTVNREAVRRFFQIADQLDILFVIAIGHPDQDVRLTDADKKGDYRYYEETDIHWVPKRALKEIIIPPPLKNSSAD